MIFKFTLALTKLGKNKSIVQQQNVFGHAAVFYSNALLFLVSSKTDLEQETNAPSFSRAGFSHVQLLATKDHIQYSQNQEPTSEQSIFGAFCECSRLSYLIKMCPSLSQNAFTTYRQIIRQDRSVVVKKISKLLTKTWGYIFEILKNCATFHYIHLHKQKKRSILKNFNNDGFPRKNILLL